METSFNLSQQVSSASVVQFSRLPCIEKLEKLYRAFAKRSSISFSARFRDTHEIYKRMTKKE